MKHRFSLLLCLCSIAVHAQDGLFLAPSVGFGTSNIHRTGFGGPPPSTGSIFTTNEQLNIGYQKNNLCIYTGIEYLRTGSQEEVWFENGNSPASFDTSQYKKYFYHLILPLCVSYRIKLTKKLAIAPIAGVEFSYNLSEYSTLTHLGISKVLSTGFDQNYHHVSVFGTGQLNVEYQVSHKITLTAGPSFCYMLTNMYKVPAGAKFVAKQNNYATLFNVGMKYSLSRKTRPAAAEKAAH